MKAPYRIIPTPPPMVGDTGPVQIAIAGGGIGGLAFGVALAKVPGVEVHIYEAANAFTDIGAGIGTWSRGWEVLKKLGLGQELGSLAEPVVAKEGPTLAFRFRKSDQAEGVRLFDLQGSGGFFGFPRPAIVQALVNKLGKNCHTHFSKRVSSYSAPSFSCSPVTLQFTDGSAAQCDVLIGADGIKSSVRRYMLEDLARGMDANAQIEDGSCLPPSREAETIRNSVHPVWSGTVAYRAIFPSGELAKKTPTHQVLSTPMCYSGSLKHFVAYPVAAGKFINVIAYVSHPECAGTLFDGPIVVDVSQEEVYRIYEGWETDVLSIIECIPRFSRWAIQELNPLSHWVHGRVALLGDAAHAMTPHQAAGASQAIEDAYILGEILGRVFTACPGAAPPALLLEHAFKVYEQIRLPLANSVLMKSRDNGRMYCLSYPGCRPEDLFEIDENGRLQLGAGRVERMQKIFDAQWSWAWTTTIEDDRDQAMRLIDEALSSHIH